MCFSTASASPPMIQQPAKITDQAVTDARDQQIAKNRAAAGAGSTILTSGSGTKTTNKTLLGQ